MCVCVGVSMFVCKWFCFTPIFLYTVSPLSPLLIIVLDVINYLNLNAKHKINLLSPSIDTKYQDTIVPNLSTVAHYCGAIPYGSTICKPISLPPRLYHPEFQMFTNASSTTFFSFSLAPKHQSSNSNTFLTACTPPSNSLLTFHPPLSTTLIFPSL